MASSSNSVSWTPAPGRHVVNIGPSLGKSLKARKLKASPAATATTKRSNLPERDFYSFRFNFKPPSIDTTKPASIEIKKTTDNTRVTAEYPRNSGEALIFLGAETPAKEIDCVLIYDEDTGTYSLEKLDSFVNLHYDQRTTHRPSPAPKISPPTQQKTTKGKGKQQDMDDLERELLGLDEDAEGDLDISMIPASKPIARKEEEEEEEAKPLKPPSPVPPKARPMKPIPKSRVEAREAAATSRPPRQKPTQPPPNAATAAPVPVPSISEPVRPKSRAVPTKGQIEHKETGSISKKGPVPKAESAEKTEPTQKKKKVKPVPVPTPLPTAPPKSAPYVDEETISFSRPAKRPRPSTPQQPLPPPTPPAPVALSLPGGSSSFAPPPLPSGSHNSRSTGSSSRNVPPAPAAPASLSLPTSVAASPPMMGQYESDEEEDWDEVSTVNPASASASLPPSNSNIEAYELALEQEIFGDDVFEEVDGDEERQIPTQSYADGEGEEEEIDVNAFEQELNEHMEDVEDDSDDDVFGGLGVESEPDGTRQPISMNRLASGGAGVEMSDDEYSSSDDSDDD